MMDVRHKCKIAVEGGGRWLSVRCLPCKHEDLSVNPGTYGKWGAVVCAVLVPGGEVQTGRFWGAPWPATLTETGGERLRGTPVSAPDFCMPTYKDVRIEYIPCHD